MKALLTTLFLTDAALAFPWVPKAAGVDSSILEPRQQKGVGPGSEAQCPFNPNHEPAVPFNPKYPYNNARNGIKGNEKGGYRVPAEGDHAHRYIAPTAKDIRGPCPGLNTAANHGFLARDGITTYAELVDMQQNVYNVGYDLANLLAFLGLQADGDFVTTKLSIGCSATPRTSINPLLTGNQPGLVGHNKFEGDSSLTRGDYFPTGDNYSFNRTLFDQMTRSTGGKFDLKGLAKYREERYYECRANNPNFYFGVLSLLLFGAASFSYAGFPGASHQPDLYTMTYFFVHEQIPPNWYNRVDPYNNQKVTDQILRMYLLHPVEFGGNTADGSFNGGLNYGAIQNGKISPNITPAETVCLLYQMAMGQVPSTLNGIITPAVDALSFAAKHVDPLFENLGCPRPLTK